jgi:signal transduction histidine kinase
MRVQLTKINKEEENPEIIDRIENVSQALRTAIQATRDAIFNLSLPQLNEIGLYAAVHDWMKEQIELKYNISTSISGEDDKFHIDENTRFLLFRSIRELMMNVMKHARATRLKIEFKRNDEMLEISVRDDGIGFNYNANLLRLQSNTYGLFSIQERISDLGGSMEVDSVGGKGTYIKLLIPLKDDQL